MGHHRPPHHEDPHHPPPHHDDPHYPPPHHDPHYRPPHHETGHHSKCFIATAVHGENSIEVLTLRAYRDQVLTAYTLGRAFIASYVRLSPPLASVIAKRPSLQKLAKRFIVTPAYHLAQRTISDRTKKSERDKS